MPRRARMKDEGQVHEDLTKAGSNELSATELQGFVNEYEELTAEIDKIYEDARVAAQPLVDHQKDILKRAAEMGAEKKALRAKLRERQLRRKADAVTDSLSERQREVFAEISAKLNDLPLFRALDEAA
jgi:uncharacterized protein (UPF0335 family)